jgi:probable F420-dependent oxidoreductase
VPQRSPVYTAKQVVDLDTLSGGRVDFGIGVGWLKEEFDALGVPFANRGNRTDQYLDVMKALWTEEVSEYHGSLYDLPPCRMYPKPVQKPHPPIHIGGESDAALQRVASHGQGWYTFNRLPDQLAAVLPKLESALADAGRKRSEIELTVCPYFNSVTADQVRAYREQGVDRLVVVCLAFDEAMIAPTLDGLAKDVLGPAIG